jgi:hypothetical protein
MHVQSKALGNSNLERLARYSLRVSDTLTGTITIPSGYTTMHSTLIRSSGVHDS